MGRDSSNLGLESQPAIRMLIYSQLGSNRDPQGMEHGTRPQFCIIPLQFQWKCCHNPALNSAFCLIHSGIERVRCQKGYSVNETMKDYKQ